MEHALPITGALTKFPPVSTKEQGAPAPSGSRVIQRLSILPVLYCPHLASLLRKSSIILVHACTQSLQSIFSFLLIVKIIEESKRHSTFRVKGDGLEATHFAAIHTRCGQFPNKCKWLG